MLLGPVAESGQRWSRRVFEAINVRARADATATLQAGATDTGGFPATLFRFALGRIGGRGERSDIQFGLAVDAVHPYSGCHRGFAYDASAGQGIVGRLDQLGGAEPVSARADAACRARLHGRARHRVAGPNGL